VHLGTLENLSAIRIVDLPGVPLLTLIHTFTHASPGFTWNRIASLLNLYLYILINLNLDPPWNLNLNGSRQRTERTQQSYLLFQYLKIFYRPDCAA